MTRHLAMAAGGALAIALVFEAAAFGQTPWLFQPSSYTHDPFTGQRTVQYAPKQPAIVRQDPTYQQSAYRHNQVVLRGTDGTANRLHVVESWGAGDAIRPYGEWEYPFRAGATPYGPWGNPAGPWTTPEGAWSNPYGLGRLPVPPWVHHYAPQYPAPLAPSQPVVPSNGD